MTKKTLTSRNEVVENTDIGPRIPITEEPETNMEALEKRIAALESWKDGFSQAIAVRMRSIEEILLKLRDQQALYDEQRSKLLRELDRLYLMWSASPIQRILTFTGRFMRSVGKFLIVEVERKRD